MPVPDSSITIRAIYNEINGTSHGANATIGSGVTISSLRTASVAYTGGDGSSPNVKTTPDRFNEWADYVHAQSMGTIDYSVRIATAQADWGLNQIATDDVGPGENGEADGGIVLWRTYDSSTTYIRAKRLSLGQNQTTNTGAVYDGGSSNLTLANDGQVIIEIPVTNVAIQGAQTPLGGQGITTPVTKTHGTLGKEDETHVDTSPIISLGATAAETESKPHGQGSDDDENQAIFRITLTLTKTGYTTEVINGIVIDCHNSSQADEEDEGGGGE